MSEGAIERLAKQRIITASAEIDIQLAAKAGTRPVVMVLTMAREEAAAALADLALADDADLRTIRSLQNTVRRYDDLVGWFRKIVQLGIDYDQEITAEDRDEMIDLLARTPEGQQEIVELGLADVVDGR